MRRSFSASDLTSDSQHVDHEIKVVHKQIALAEKTFANLIKDFTNLTVDMTRLQSRQRELCNTLTDMASEESPTLKKSFMALSDSLNGVVNNMLPFINVINKQLLTPLSDSANSCKVTRENLEQCSTAKKKRVVALKSLEKMKRKQSKYPTKVTETETKTRNTVLETTKQINELESKINQFERSKAEELRTWLKVYLHSSLAYHVKAVEQYTKAYQALDLINVEEHVEHLQKTLFPSTRDSRVEFVRWNSFTSFSEKK